MMRMTLESVALLLALSVSAPAADLVGHPRIVDGDTLKFGRTYVRFGGGVDAPERHQLCHRDGQPWHCGEDAAAALVSLIGGRLVTCEDQGHDYYKRVLGDCRVGSTDLNSEMVRQGWALDYPHYSHGRYAPEQKQAQAARRGLWAGQFIPPWEWRREQHPR